MTAERKPKGKKKSAGGAGGAPAAAGPSSELESYDSIESALGEPRRQPKRRAGSPSAADAKHGGAVGSRRCGGWPLCLLAVSLAVAVASSACFFYGDVVLDSLDEYGMNTVALRELYNSAVARHLVADESTPKHAASTSDGDQLPSGDSVLSSVDHLAAVNDQPAGRDEPEGDAAEPLVSDSPYDEVATDRNEEVAVGTSDDRLPDPAEAEGADGLSEAGEVFVPPLDELSPGDDDVVLSIGKATDDRWEPTERQLAAAGAAEEREPAAGGVPPLATTDVPLSSEYDLLAQDVPSGTVEPQTEGQQQQQDEQQPWQQDEQWQWQQDEQQQQRQDEQSQWQQDEQQQQQNEHQPWQQQDEQKQQQQQQQQQDEQQPWQQDEQWQWQQDEKQQQRQDEQSQWQQDEQQQQQNEQQPWQQQQQQQEENDRQQEQQQGVEQQQEQQEDEQQKVDDESPSPQQLPADDSDLSAADAEPAAAADAAYDAHGEQQRSDDASAPPADDGERAASPDGASYAGSDAAAETGDDRAYSESYQEPPLNPDYIDLGQPDFLFPAADEAHQPDTLPFDEPAAALQSGESADAVEAGTEAGVAADAPLRSYIEVETLVGVESPGSAAAGEADDYLSRSDLEALTRLAALVPKEDDHDVPSAAWDASGSADDEGLASASTEQGYSYEQAAVAAHEDIPQDVEPNDWQPTPPNVDAGDAEGEPTTPVPPHGFGREQSEADGSNDAEVPTASQAESDLPQPAYGFENDWSEPQDVGLDRASVGYDYQHPGDPNAFADAANAAHDVSYAKFDAAEQTEEQRVYANAALGGDNLEPILDGEPRSPANEGEVRSTGYESFDEVDASDELESASAQAESEPLVLAPSWGYPDEYGLAPEREGASEQANVEQSRIPSE